jgi:hypothetical protein
MAKAMHFTSLLGRATQATRLQTIMITADDCRDTKRRALWYI